MDFLNKVPKPVLVFAVFVLGISFIFYSNKPHSICDSQAENMIELQRGFIYPKKVKGGTAKGVLPKTIKECREGMGNPGACFDAIQILKKLTQDLESVDSSCGDTITKESAEYSPIRKAIADGILLLVQIAWGDAVPAAEEKPHHWLGPPEFALFCSLKEHWVRFYGLEGWESFKDLVFSQLPGGIYEVKPDGKRRCTNCVKSPEGTESAPGALRALGSKEAVFNQSLLSIKCEKYR